MKKKKLLTAFTVVLSALTLTAGCNKKPKSYIVDGSDKDKIETYISLYGFKAEESDYKSIENIINSFVKTHSTISMGYEGIKGNDYWTTLEIRYQNNSLDDLFMVDQEHVIAMENVMADLSDCINLDLFSDLAQAQVKRADGTVRFIPITLASYCMYVNYDLLAENNIKVPETYGEFAEACNYFKTQKGITPVICNQRRSLCSLVQGKALFEVYQQPNSSEIIENFNHNPELLAEQLTPGLEFVESLFTNGWVDPIATLNTLQTSPDATKNGDLWQFSKGEQPFLISGSWASPRLANLLNGSDKKFDYGVHPYPIMEDGSVLVMDINNCVSVNADGENVSQAKEFISHLTKPDSIWEYCDNQSCFSPLKNETRTPTDSTVAPTAAYYTNGRAVIGTNYQLAMPLDRYLMDVTAMMCNGSTAAEAAAELKTRLIGFGGKKA